jgi:hypothetical protein
LSLLMQTTNPNPAGHGEGGILEPK